MMAGPRDEEGFRSLTRKIERDRKFGCANYKDGCLQRRIAVRMRARGVVTYDEYAALLDREPTEYELLLDALTINVTKLYRDAEAWEALRKEVIPRLWDLALPRLSVWSAGCSSGEELYTLAMLFHAHAERTGTLARLRTVRIVGSDIDRASLDRARAGAYASEAFAEMPAPLRARYFTPIAPHSAVPELRALVEVERRDLLQEAAPAGGFQLICCRNVVIYFGRESQEPLMRKFHEALAPGGFLMLGKVETLLGPSRSLFETVDQRQRIFRKAA
jgi:chemotaxis protein methyltransferase CheR